MEPVNSPSRGQVIPTGTVTFLFTDIEGSTALWQKYPATMPDLLARHHAILRNAIEAHNGYVFQIVGDAFCAAFATALDALAATTDAQAELAQWIAEGGNAPIKVRMGLHTGTAELHVDDVKAGQYASGITLTRMQRIMSAGHGGQILVSSSTYELLRGQLPSAVTLRDLSEHRLAGLLNPEHLWQVIAPGLPQDFPPLRSLNAIPNNLPIQLTSFVGREKELELVKQLLATNRLLTLTGPGGTGKTRLSLHVAAAVLATFKDGVWFIELAPLSDPTLVPATIANVLGVREVSGHPLLETLREYFNDKHTLLLLDNCEHLIEACAKFAGAILHSCPNTRILASSREPLGIAGESVWRVPSLATPNPKESLSVPQLEQYAAVRLFIDRATQAMPVFSVNHSSAPAVAQICSRLDGIPLAIELAAARVKVLPVEKIAERLDDRFRLLVGGSRTALPRQQTLRALIDWSYNLLSAPERLVFHRLSVFAGGWTLETAERVAVGTDVDETDLLDLLGSLVEKSLVTRNTDIDRYGMLQTLRQYASEKLAASGETATYRQIHAEYFLKFAEEADPQLSGNDQAKWFNRLEVEHDNLRAALEWSLNSNKIETAQRLCGALGRFWWVRGHMTEGRRWLKRALEHREGIAKSVQARALRWAGGLAWPQGDLNSAKVFLNESLALYREIGDQAGMARVLGHMGTVAQDEKDYVDARDLYRQSLDLYRALGNQWGMANALNNLGNVAQEQHDFATAQPLFEESLALRRELADERGTGIALINLGSIALEQNKVAAARAFIEESLKINSELGAKMMVAYNLSGMAQILEREELACSAAQLQGATSKLLAEMGAPFEPYEQSLYEKTAIALKQVLGDKAYQQAYQSGKAMSLEQAVDFALRRHEEK